MALVLFRSRSLLPIWFTNRRIGLVLRPASMIRRRIGRRFISLIGRKRRLVIGRHFDVRIMTSAFVREEDIKFVMSEEDVLAEKVCSHYFPTPSPSLSPRHLPSAALLRISPARVGHPCPPAIPQSIADHSWARPTFSLIDPFAPRSLPFNSSLFGMLMVKPTLSARSACDLDADDGK